MKTLSFSRRQIFRAIQAACIALFFAACSGQAFAQDVGPGFTQNGSSVTGSGTHSGTYFYDGSTNGYSVTIQGGANLQNTGSTYTNLIQFDNGSVTNSGSLYGNKGTNSNAIYIGRATSAGNGSTLSGSVNNTASGYIYGSHSAVYMYNDISGGSSISSNMSVNNAGTLVGDTSNSDYAIGLFGYNHNTTGSISNNSSINNTSTGSIYGHNEGLEVYNSSNVITGSVNNVVSLTNAGSIYNSASNINDDSGAYFGGDNEYVTGNASNSLYVGNTNSIYGSYSGVYVYNYNDETGGSATNTFTLNNTGSSASLSGYYAGVLGHSENDYTTGNASNTAVLTNTGSIYNDTISDSKSSYSGISYYNENNRTTGNATNTLTLNNTGATASISGSYAGVYVYNYNVYTTGNASNTLTVNNSGSMSGSDYYGLDAYNENASTTGNVTNTYTLNNSGTISGYYAGVYSYNESYYTTGNASNTAVLTNTGTIQNSTTSTSHESYSGLYFYNYNYETGGNAANVLTFNNTGVTASISGYYNGADVSNESDFTTGSASNTLTVNNSGSITGSAYYGLKALNENNHTIGSATNTLTLNNSGSLSGYYAGVYAYNENYYTSGDASNTLSFSNSGTITASATSTSKESSSGVYLENYNYQTTGNASNTLSVLNTSTGVITGSYAGVYAYNKNNGGIVVGKNATNTLTVNNAGQMTGSNYGLYAYNENDTTTGNATNTLTVNNSGTINGTGQYGVEAFNYNSSTGGNSSNTLTFINSGTVIGHNGYGGVYLYNQDISTSGTSTSAIYVVNTNTGTISTTGASSSGLYTDNETSGSSYKTKVTNAGTISGSSYGVFLKSAYSSLLTTGGMISGGSIANDSVYLGGDYSSVAVQGRTNMVGIIEGNNFTHNTLTLDLAFVTPAEAATANAANGQATGNIVVGGDTYHWKDFTGSNVTVDAVSAETVVDSGLKDIATKLDNNVLPSPAYDALYAAGAANPEAALNSLTGREFLDAFSQIGLSNATEFGSQADSRAFALRSGSTGMDFSALNLSPSTMIASLGNMQNALSRMSGTSLLGGTSMSDSRDDKAMISSDNSRWGAWAAGTVTFADQSSTSTTPGYNATSGSPTFGIDYRVCPELVVGALFNYTTGGVNFGDSSNLDTDTYLGGIYVDWTHKGWFVNGLAAGGITDYHQNRTTLSGADAQASPSGSEELVTLSTGYDFKTGGFVISPEFGLQYTHLNKDAFNESGAGAFDLNVGSQDVNSLRTKLGLNVDRPFTFSGIKYTPQANAFWYHECLDVTNGVSNSLPGAPGVGSFVVQTNSAGRDFALVGAGLNATPDSWHGNVDLFVNYEAQVGQSNFIAQTVDGGVRIGF